MSQPQTRYYGSTDNDTLYRIDPNGDIWLGLPDLGRWIGPSKETSERRINEYEHAGLLIAIEEPEATARLAQHESAA